MESALFKEIGFDNARLRIIKQHVTTSNKAAVERQSVYRTPRDIKFAVTSN